MARCEDYPCCGHELGCCPDYDEETGEQLNMKCVCGATLPIDNGSSLCDGCLHDPDCPGCSSRHCANNNDDYPWEDDAEVIDLGDNC